MKLSAPKMVTWAIALVIGLIGILAYLVPITGVTPFAFWLVVIAFVLLLIATAVEGV